MYSVPSIEERVDYYLSPALLKLRRVKEKLPPIKYSCPESKRELFFDLKWQWGKHGESSYNTYIRPAIKRFNELNLDALRIPIIVGDVADSGSNFLYSKSRLQDNNSTYTLLKCLEEKRHWGSSSSVSSTASATRDILRYSDKRPIAVFRGATSGGMHGWDLRPANRYKLVERYFNCKNPNVDVGFSVFGQGNDNIYNKYRKDAMTIPQQLEYKYIISVEGNDKDSGLQWKLKSNSLVLMARPRISSWLMESTLIPNYHYIELRDDFEDLEEKIEWCNKNYEECIQIIINASDYMNQFNNITQERDIEKKVIEKHASSVYYI